MRVIFRALAIFFSLFIFVSQGNAKVSKTKNIDFSYILEIADNGIWSGVSESARFSIQGKKTGYDVTSQFSISAGYANSKKTKLNVVFLPNGWEGDTCSDYSGQDLIKCKEVFKSFTGTGNSLTPDKFRFSSELTKNVMSKIMEQLFGESVAFANLGSKLTAKDADVEVPVIDIEVTKPFVCEFYFDWDNVRCNSSIRLTITADYEDEMPEHF